MRAGAGPRSIEVGRARIDTFETLKERALEGGEVSATPHRPGAGRVAGPARVTDDEVESTSGGDAGRRVDDRRADPSRSSSSTASRDPAAGERLVDGEGARRVRGDGRRASAEHEDRYVDTRGGALARPATPPGSDAGARRSSRSSPCSTTTRRAALHRRRGARGTRPPGLDPRPGRLRMPRACPRAGRRRASSSSWSRSASSAGSACSRPDATGVELSLDESMSVRGTGIAAFVELEAELMAGREAAARDARPSSSTRSRAASGSVEGSSRPRLARRRRDRRHRAPGRRRQDAWRDRRRQRRRGRPQGAPLPPRPDARPRAGDPRRH